MTEKNPHARHLGRLGGLVKSEAKTKSGRENIKKALEARLKKHYENKNQSNKQRLDDQDHPDQE